MAKPFGPETHTKDSIVVYTNETEKELIRQAAGKKGMSRFLLDLGLEAAMGKTFMQGLPKTTGPASDAVSDALCMSQMWQEEHDRLMAELKRFSPRALEKALAAAQAEQRWIDEHDREKGNQK